MKKNISKVLSVMCGVAALAGMFSINSVGAMDAPKARPGCKKVYRHPLAKTYRPQFETPTRPVPKKLTPETDTSEYVPSYECTGRLDETFVPSLVKVKRPAPRRLTRETVSLELFENLKKRFPSMTKEEFEKLELEVTLRDPRPLGPDETLEGRIAKKYEARKMLEKQEEEEREALLKKLREGMNKTEVSKNRCESFFVPGCSRAEVADTFHRIQIDCIRALGCMLRGTGIEEAIGGCFDSSNVLSGFEEILAFMKKYEGTLSRDKGYHILYEFVDFLLNGFKPRWSRDYASLTNRVADFKERFYSARS